MGKRGKKSKKMPQNIPRPLEEAKVPEGEKHSRYCMSDEEILRLLDSVTREKSTFHSESDLRLHAAVVNEDRLCISTTLPNLSLIEPAALAETANTVNMLGIGSFWTKAGDNLVLRTASVLAPGAENQDEQIRAMVKRHNENLCKSLGQFLR